LGGQPLLLNMNNRPVPTLQEPELTSNFNKHIVGFHKSAILVLFGLVVLQFIFIHMVVDAGEMTSNALLDCTNTIRTEKTGTDLVLNNKLSVAAEKKLDDMKADDYWAHQNPKTGKQPWDFIDDAGYNYETAGENLAIGFTDSQKICDAWSKSKLHYENIVNPSYQEVGFAIDKANLHKNAKGILVVQMFGSHKDFSTDVSAQGKSTTQQTQVTNILPGDQSGTPQILGKTDNMQESELNMNNTLFFVILSSLAMISFGVLFRKSFLNK
jgi:uncharacterized protein YkwD